MHKHAAPANQISYGTVGTSVTIGALAPVHLIAYTYGGNENARPRGTVGLFQLCSESKTILFKGIIDNFEIEYTRGG